MATTPIYGFVTPDLSGSADGPAALSALALRVERELPTVRATNEYNQEPNAAYGAGTTNNLIHSVSVPTSVIGWMEIHAFANLGMAGASGADFSTQVYAGALRLVAAGSTLRTVRVHTLWAARTLTYSLFGVIARTAANSTTAIELRLDLDGGGTGVYVNNTSILATQIGAPGSG